MDQYTCKRCGNSFQGKIHQMICPMCEDALLFSAAKDYIRENDVNEFQVADYLDIPISKVKGWIREGKITYKIDETNKGNYIAWKQCQICGDSLGFGTICTKCMHRQKVKGVYNGQVTMHESEQMRFINPEQIKRINKKP